MDAGEILLDHLDRMAQSEPRFVRISKEGVKPAISLAIYRDFPVPEHKPDSRLAYRTTTLLMERIKS